MTWLTAGALTDPQLHASASNACTTDARLGGVCRVPQQNPGYADVTDPNALHFHSFSGARVKRKHKFMVMELERRDMIWYTVAGM